jgi:hypothetical protein
MSAQDAISARIAARNRMRKKAGLRAGRVTALIPYNLLKVLSIMYTQLVAIARGNPSL